MTRPLRVVFDTSVVLLALFFPSGRVGWVFSLWTSGRVVPLVSKETADELLRVLAYPKFRLALSEQKTVLEAFLPYAEVVPVGGRLHLPECRDPHDLPFLALAVSGQADCLVTGDRDLLAVRGFEVCPIVTPEAFRQMMTVDAWQTRNG